MPCDNEFERKFAQFLQDAPDVAALRQAARRSSASPSSTPTRASNLRYYEPDFVAVLADGTHWLVETKGREDTDVAHKDRAASIWCENATLLTGTPWQYLKVPQKGFEQLHADEFADLMVLAPGLA